MIEPTVEQLEHALYCRLLEDRPRKVALIITLATDEFPGFWEGKKAAEDLIDKALSLLDSRDDVRSFGDIHNWRHSEMCRNANQR